MGHLHQLYTQVNNKSDLREEKNHQINNEASR